jgi:hypothetical protein
LDIADGSMILHGTAQNQSILLNSTSSLIKTGRNNGSWTGHGITSSTAAGNTKHLTGLAISSNSNGNGTPLFTSFSGEPVTVGDVLIKYTYNGDMNLDGKVDAEDYFRIDRGFANTVDPQSPLKGYQNGDIDLNGFIDADDLFLTDYSFATQNGVLNTGNAKTLTTRTRESSIRQRSRHHRRRQ